MLKITAKTIVDELRRRNVPVEILEERYGIIRYKNGDNWRLLRSSASDDASWLGSFVARHKQLTHEFLRDEDLGDPATMQYSDEASAVAFLQTHEQVVVKPTDAGHGNGVTTGIRTKEALLNAIASAQRASRSGTVILQEQLRGEDVRVLIIGGTYAAAALRTPATVVGDGKRTLRQLIERENEQNEGRGSNYQKRLNYIDIAAAEIFLGGRIDADTPALGEVVRVTGPANIGMGGTSMNLTSELPEQIIRKSERIAKKLGLPTCGVDFMVEDPADAASYRFIEVNACPSFGLHLFPTIGRPEPVAVKLVDYLLSGVNA